MPMPRGHGWTAAKVNKLIALWPTHSAVLIAQEINKSPASVRAKVKVLGLIQKGRGYSQMRKRRSDSPPDPTTLEEALEIIARLRGRAKAICSADCNKDIRCPCVDGFDCHAPNWYPEARAALASITPKEG